MPEEDFPHVHISNFYFSFNDKFTEKYGTYRNVVNLAKTEQEAIEQFKLPFFVFKFHHKHFLISAKPIRNEMLDPIKKLKEHGYIQQVCIMSLTFERLSS